MRFLVDTNVLLWAALDERRLTSPAVAALTDPEGEGFLSPVSPWELAIKLRAGKWELDMPLSAMVEAQMSALLLGDLPVTNAHALRIQQLPEIHRDPFDRMLIAQALVEDMAIVTADRRFAEYGVPVVW